MANEEYCEGATTLRDTFVFHSDVSWFFMKDTFSDVTLLLKGQKIRAHKIVLATRSSYFHSLLLDNPNISELSLLHVPPKAFLEIVKYIYTGSITMHSKDLIHDIFELTHYFGFGDLEKLLTEYVVTILDMRNIFTFLNDSNRYDMVGLRAVCHEFINKHIKEIFGTDCFNVLTQKSIIKLLEERSLSVPEIEIFNIAAKWCRSNEDIDNMVIQCVCLSELSEEEILSIVWPSKLVDSDKLLSVLAEIKKKQPQIKPHEERLRERKEKFQNIFRIQKVKDINIAASGFHADAKVMTGMDTDMLLKGGEDIMKLAYHPIDGKSSITVDLGVKSYFNHIKMSLTVLERKVFVGYQSYYVEISSDYTIWEKIIDYSKYPCQGHQKLYFEQKLGRYIRIVGTAGVGKQFCLARFEVYFKSNIPKVLDQIVCPLENVATYAMGALVSDGMSSLLDGDYENRKLGASHFIGQGSLIVQLAQPYMISSMRLLLSEGSAYKYFIETSMDGENWKSIGIHPLKVHRSWQIHTFQERPVIYIKITGTYSSTQKFHCIYFECPSNPTRPRSNPVLNTAFTESGECFDDLNQQQQQQRFCCFCGGVIHRGTVNYGVSSFYAGSWRGAKGASSSSFSKGFHGRRCRCGVFN